VFDYARLPHEFRRNFLPAHLAPSDWGQLEKAFTSLENREIRSRKELEEWLGDESELSAAIFEESAVRYVRMTTQTGNNDYEKAYLDFVENVQPKAKEREFLLDRKYVGCRFRSELRKDYYYVIDRRKENNVSLFRNENVELEKQDAKLGQQYYKVAGAMTVQFEGQERTMQYMRRYLEEPDRGLRQRAWEASEGRRLRDRGKLDQVFDDLVRVRHRIAVNAGFENYRDYAFRKKERFEYTPEDAFRFHDAVEGSFVPLAREIYEKAKERLGIDTLRPWDIFADPEGKRPLLPFNSAEDLVRGCIQIHESVSPDLANQFKRLRDLNLLDLESRPGKAPGGYNYELSEVRLPFIFTNAVGRDDDVYTLLHESGHAFHTFATREAGLLFDYRGESIPSEFAEVASTAMEFIGGEHLSGVFYDEGDATRSMRSHLSDMVRLMGWVATIDSFQQWVYTHPDHSRDERSEFWVGVQEKYGVGESWEGYEEARESYWQRQLHLFEVPFYYIEYNIAALGAINLWLRYRKDPKDTVEAYRGSLSLGGSKPIPELFEAAGIPWDFGKGMVDRYANELRRVLTSLEEAKVSMKG